MKEILENYNILICNNDISNDELENRKIFEKLNKIAVDNFSKSNNEECYKIFNSIHVYADELREEMLNKKLNSYQEALINLKIYWAKLLCEFKNL